MYVYQRRHVHVETRRRLTKFEVRTQVPPLMHWCVCGEKGDDYNMVLCIYTQRLNNNRHLCMSAHVAQKAMLIWYYDIYTQRLYNN